MDFAILQKTLQELQNKNELKEEENHTLRRQNTDLETARNKFIQLHRAPSKSPLNIRFVVPLKRISDLKVIG